MQTVTSDAPTLRDQAERLEARLAESQADPAVLDAKLARLAKTFGSKHRRP